MTNEATVALNMPGIERRAGFFLDEARIENYKRVDRMFAALLIAQWIAAIIVAIVISPYAWSGKTHVVHAHVWAALIIGGVLDSLPLALIFLKPGQLVTRMVVAASQMAWSALLIHLSGGRIETHFHVFGSLAFLAFYRDWRVLLPATITVAADHVLRQLYWPESVYGILNPEWWRFLEHAGWVVFIDFFLFLSCFAAVREMRAMARKRGESETLLKDLQASHEQLIRTEKLAAVGQLAASVGHELRNPLATVRNAVTYLAKRIADPSPEPLVSDPRVQQFLQVIDRELTISGKIINDLLDFARERPPQLQPCPLKPLVEEALGVVAGRPNVRLMNEVPADLPIPTLDKEQIRQVVINLAQNAVESVPESKSGEVRVNAEGGGNGPWRLTVADNGAGIPAEVQEKIFLPLFTTKTKGTGLGLAIVSGMVKRHNGTIRVESQPGEGTRFIIELPAQGAQAQTKVA